MQRWRTSHASAVRQFSTNTSKASRPLCSFPFFLDGKRHDGVASSDNIVFRSKNVLVFQEGLARIMVFYSEGRDGRHF